MTNMQKAARPGFNLIELLVVIGISGLLLSLLLPAVQAAREAALRASCQNNLRQVGIAAANFESARGNLPPDSAEVGTILPLKSPGCHVNLPWQVLLLPFIEQDALWQQTLEAYLVTWNNNANPPHIGLATVIRTYACPSDGRLMTPITDDKGYTAAYGSYLGIEGGTGKKDPTRPNYTLWPSDGAITSSGVRFAEITDGTSQTLLIGERPPAGRYFFGAWYTGNIVDQSFALRYYFLGIAHTMPVFWPFDANACDGPFYFGPGRVNNPCDFNHFWSLHPGGANFVFADASVRFLPYSAVSVMVPLATRAGGEVIDETW